jgi:hypothetical protein
MKMFDNTCDEEPLFLRLFVFLTRIQSSIRTPSVILPSYVIPKGNRIFDPLICYSPSLKPLHVAVFLVWSGHSPANRHEENVKTNSYSVQNTVKSILDTFNLVFQHPVGKKAHVQDGKVESRIIVVNIGDTSHGDEWQIVKEPTNDWIYGGIMNLIDIGLLELVVTTLPSYKIPHNEKSNESQACSRAPIDERVAKEEVLDNGIIPSTHAKTNMEKWPLPKLGSKIVLLVRVRDKCIIGSHHSNIQVDEILQEW